MGLFSTDGDVDEWRRKGGTISDKTARKEFGLTQEEIVEALRDGKLHYRHAAMHGNPWLRLLRREVEALVARKRGGDHLRTQKAIVELARVDREMKRLRGEIATLEERRTTLLTELKPKPKRVSPK
jgi:hypothetical protein